MVTIHVPGVRCGLPRLAVNVTVLPGISAFTAGLYFAACQVGYFLHMEFNLSSTFVSFYVTIGMWLLGGLLGLCVRRAGLGPLTMAVGLGAYYAHWWILTTFPFEMRWLPLYLFFIFATAVYSGYFFRQARPQFGSARSLFFHENNGFLLGYVVALVDLLLYGQTAQQILPVVTAVGHLISQAVARRGKVSN